MFTLTLFIRLGFVRDDIHILSQKNEIVRMLHQALTCIHNLRLQSMIPSPLCQVIMRRLLGLLWTETGAKSPMLGELGGFFIFFSSLQINRHNLANASF